MFQGFSLNKKVHIIGNKLWTASYYFYIIVIVLAIFGWVILNDGHIKIDTNMYSTISIKTREAILTNYSAEDFNRTYVTPEEYDNYNRVWDRNDYSKIYPDEIHVMTNMAITANQTVSICPDNPLINNIECNPNKNRCSKGFRTSNGILTGRCVKADFPLNHDHRNNSGFACEMEGWCPVDRMLVPLNNYKAVLIETINSTLYIDNSVEFPNEGKVINNLLKDKCYYDPVSDPYCPIFKLGDIIRFTPNANDSYAEIAKFGATFMINIEWKCFLPLLSQFDCKPNYSFRRVDVWRKHSQIIYNLKAFYNSNGDKRKIIRSYNIRFQVQVKASLRKYDLFYFLTISSAYIGEISIMIWLFTLLVRYKFGRNTIEDDVDIGETSTDPENASLIPVTNIIIN